MHFVDTLDFIASKLETLTKKFESIKVVNATISSSYFPTYCDICGNNGHVTNEFNLVSSQEDDSYDSNQYKGNDPFTKTYNPN